MQLAIFPRVISCSYKEVVAATLSPTASVSEAAATLALPDHAGA
jgi:hypothetical protein